MNYLLIEVGDEIPVKSTVQINIDNAQAASTLFYNGVDGWDEIEFIANNGTIKGKAYWCENTNYFIPVDMPITIGGN